MSDSALPTNQCKSPNNPGVQRRENNIPNNSLVHSSLEYTSLKAPPIVEYNSVYSYCDKKVGKSLLPSNKADGSSLCDISNIKSISSPIVIKSPIKPTKNRVHINNDYVPSYAFFSIEELSIVKSLSHWNNNKICPIGLIQFDAISKEYFLHSVLEKGSWKVLLDILLLNEAPKLNLVLQIYGNIEIVEGNPVIKIHFYRNLASADINLLKRSYRIMQKRISGLHNSFEKSVLDKSKNCVGSEAVCELNDNSFERSVLDKSKNCFSLDAACELNDTLDDYNFSVFEKNDENSEVQSTCS